MAPDLVVPGDCIARASESLVALEGTFTRNQHVFASLAGRLESRETSLRVIPFAQRPLQPSAGALVTCRVLSIAATAARLEIHAIDGHVIKQPFRAVLTREHVSSQDIQREMSASVRPGDVLLARVVGETADGRNGFHVSIAEDELGVVVALSRLSGQVMKPVSWTEMVCPLTSNREPRKVAKLL